MARSECVEGTQPGDAGHSTQDQEIELQFSNGNWTQVVQLAAPVTDRSPDANFAYGMALAHLQRWSDARGALLAGYRKCPRQERFSVELAGAAFQLKHYPESARWLLKALKLNPEDEYANDFAGTVYLLMGNVNAALKYWNPIRKPEVTTIQFDSQLRVQRLILDRAFTFSPAAVLNKRDYETTQSRLNALGIFPAYNIALTARSDGRFDAALHASERNGFGNGWLQATVSTFSGVAYETVYPSYYNLNGAAANLEALFRWDSQKRRAWLSLSGPLRAIPQRRGALQLDARDENWAIRNSFTGASPVLGSFNLARQSAAAAVTGIPSGRLQWSAGAEVSNRRFHHVESGTVLTSALVEPGISVKAFGSVQGRILDIPQRHFTITACSNTAVARMWPAHHQPSVSPHLFESLQASASAHWFPQMEGDGYELQQRVGAGHIFGTAPIDELYPIGMERDTDLWLRGHVGTRDGKKGNSPLANSYLLANFDFFRRVYSNGLISIKAGPLLDIARAAVPAGGLSNAMLASSERWLFDTGAQVKIRVLGAGVVLTWGHDLRTGNSAFYGTTTHP